MRGSVATVKKDSNETYTRLSPAGVIRVVALYSPDLGKTILRGKFLYSSMSTKVREKSRRSWFFRQSVPGDLLPYDAATAVPRLVREACLLLSASLHRHCDGLVYCTTIRPIHLSKHRILDLDHHIGRSSVQQLQRREDSLSCKATTLTFGLATWALRLQHE